MRLAVPVTLAQLVNVLYNIMDRIYIGIIPENTVLSLIGLGLCLPIISTVIASANLPGMGSALLCSIERGRRDGKEVEAITDNSFVMMVAVGILLTVLGLMFKRSILYLFGTNNATISYVDVYVIAYLTGNIFIMTGLDMNGFINSQGFGTMGMVTVLPGVVTNIVLDLVFISVFNMGVRGAAPATIFSQMLSALWILAFFTGGQTVLKLRPFAVRLNYGKLLHTVGLSVSGFAMSVTNSLIQIMYNSMLQKFGGNLYMGIMIVINSIKEVISMPVNGLADSAQSVLGFDYGTREYKRVQKSIAFVSVVRTLYIVVAWGFVDWFPAFFIRIFNQGDDMVETGIPAIRMYPSGFFMVSLQFAEQSVFVGLGESRSAIFFSILRKVIIAIPLITILPAVFRAGAQEILMAGPISNLIGGGACFGTMLLTVWPGLKRNGGKIHSWGRKNQ